MRTITAALVISVATGFIATRSLAQTNAPADDGTLWARQILQAYQQLQEQQLATLRAVGPARQDAEAASRRDTEAIDARMKQLEQVVGAQREREIDTIQNSHRFTLIIVGLFAGAGFFGMLVFALLLLRSLNRRAEVAAAHPIGPSFGHPYPAAALGTGDTQLVSVDPTQSTTARFLSTIERLEKRIGELETTTQPFVVEQPAVHPKAAAPETRRVESASVQSTEAQSISQAAAPGRAETDQSGRVALLL